MVFFCYVISMENKFYITTAIPYVNARPHIGHALEFIQADAVARYHRILGENVRLLSGSDDNAIKNVQAAEKEGVPIEDFVEKNSNIFKELLKRLNVSIDVFQKGSDKERHYGSSQKFWELCNAAGDIYKKSYEGLYCVGCEIFYAFDELNENGECYEHPGRKLEIISEENYFFRLSKYQNQLIELIKSDVLRIIPLSRKNEVLSFLNQPLQDISISRSNERAKNWGVPVPNDDSQRMYVWFDALNIYQSGIGFGWDDEEYKKWWPADAHVIGKGIIRFHAVYWPAFLLSANLPLPKSLLVHGYITINGQKMSKTLGNVIDPFDIIKKYGVDPTRYFMLREITTGEDGDFTYEKFEDRYNGDLANGLGNFAARVLTLAAGDANLRIHANDTNIDKIVEEKIKQTKDLVEQKVSDFRLNEALEALWSLIHFGDRYVNEKKPWEKHLTFDQRQLTILNLVVILDNIASLLAPFLPETAEKITKSINWGDGKLSVKKIENLFPRLTPHRAEQ